MPFRSSRASCASARSSASASACRSASVASSAAANVPTAERAPVLLGRAQARWPESRRAASGRPASGRTAPLWPPTRRPEARRSRTATGRGPIARTARRAEQRRDDRPRGPRRDAGGPALRLYATTEKKGDAAETGDVLWSRSISEYNGIAGLALAHEPGVRARDGLRRRSERQHDGRRRRDGRSRAGSRSSIRTRTRSSPTSPIVLGNRLYIATRRRAAARLVADLPRQHDARSTCGPARSSGSRSCCPDNGGVPGGFAGGAFVNPPAIDLETRPRVRGGRSALYAASGGHGVPRGGARRLERGVFPRGRALQLGDRVRPPHRRAAVVVPRRRPRRAAARVRQACRRT